MMGTYGRLAYVVPVGPTCVPDFVCDTVESIVYYDPCGIVLVVDDSGRGTGHRALTHCNPGRSQIIVVQTAGRSGKGPGLYLVLSEGLKRAADFTGITGIVRMDTDALIINRGLNEAVTAFFNANPKVGIAGSHWIASNGQLRDVSGVAARVRHVVSIFWPVRHPRRTLRRPLLLRDWLFVRKLVFTARRNGYVWGEHCMGGAYVLNPRLLTALKCRNWLHRREFLYTGLEEDAIFAILTYGAGFTLADFATDGKPLGVKWKGLPFSPEELVRRGKSLIHSTRFWEGMNECEIRGFFASIRLRGVIAHEG